MPPTRSAVIERLEVTGGFLDRLDLRFTPGLNVIVGARGTGKTSVIELLRYCTGAPSLTERYGTRAQEHALSVLRDGKATVTIRIGEERYQVSRSARQESLELRPPLPIVLSQNEVEVVGVDERSRLRLLDDFRDADSAPTQLAASSQSKVRSLARELVALDSEIVALEEQVEEASSMRERLNEARKAANAGQESMAGASDLFASLDSLGHRLAEETTARTVLKRTLDAIDSWQERISAVIRSQPSLESWPLEGINPLRFIASEFDSASGELESARLRAAAMQRFIESALSKKEQTLAELDDRARALRTEAEAVRSGAGAAARSLSELQERYAQLEQLSKALASQKERRELARRQRDEAVRDLERLRQQRFDERLEIARRLNAALAPRVRIELEKGGLFAGYADAIADALRGSGLQYNQIAPVLAERVAPSELARAVEGADNEWLARVGNVSVERATKILSHLREHGLGDILAAAVDDNVALELLDGDRYKPSTSVSTGQRCTIVLPIVLQHSGRPVILDQPEDHLDTAFIVDTLVQALRARSEGSQLIVSTHNANVPVLGDADSVTILHSDGTRGFVRCAGPLNQPDIVHSIEAIMEGGREAFATRAAFYTESRLKWTLPRHDGCSATPTSLSSGKERGGWPTTRRPDRAFVAKALASHPDQWVLRALSEALARLEVEPLEEPAVLADGEDDYGLAVADAYTKGVRETTRVLVHELRRFVGIAKLSAGDVVKEYEASEVKQDLDRLVRIQGVWACEQGFRGGARSYGAWQGQTSLAS